MPRPSPECSTAIPGLIEHRDTAERSLLHLAAEHDALESAEVMFIAGVDFYARDVNGQLALDVPPGETLNATRQWLREHNQKRNALLAAIVEGDLQRVNELLTADPTLVATRDIGDGWSGVMFACHFDRVEILKRLIEAGASLEHTDFNSGQTAVGVCAERGHVECLRVLLAAGAKVDRRATVGYGSLPMQMNALHVASWKGHDEVVRLLLQAGVDHDDRATSYAMLTPLHFAATEGHTEIARLLIDAGADVSAIDGRRGITALQMSEAGKHDETAVLLRQTSL